MEGKKKKEREKLKLEKKIFKIFTNEILLKLMSRKTLNAATIFIPFIVVFFNSYQGLNAD